MDRIINQVQLTFAQLLDEELYLPIKQELKEQNIVHSLGIKKESLKNKVEALFMSLKQDLKDIDRM